MQPSKTDEWRVIESLLPSGWRDAARAQKAFRRARYIDDPADLLRLILYHAVNDGGLRETVAQARASGIAELSQVALLKRLRTSGDWLSWIGAGLCSDLREASRIPEGLRPRVIDSTTVQGPASKGIEWRIHYALDLVTLNCDWYEVTDGHGAEMLERTPMRPGDVIIADRNYLSRRGATAAIDAGAHLLVRLKWHHTPMQDERGRRFNALSHAKRLAVGEVGSWKASLVIGKDSHMVPGRVVATKMPAPVASMARRRAVRESQKKCRSLDPRTLDAAQFVMVFTTLPEEILGATDVLELYRYRWQVELAFKRMKQLLRLGRLPHKDPIAAKTWIQAKLVVALLLETLYRNAIAFSPWGYRFAKLPPRAAN